MQLLSATTIDQTPVLGQDLSDSTQDRMLTTIGNALGMRYKNICKGFQRTHRKDNNENAKQNQRAYADESRIAIITKKQQGETGLVRNGRKFLEPFGRGL